MSPLVDVIYTRIGEELPPNKYLRYLHYLTPELQKQNTRFLRWEDRHANLLGKILLLEGLKKYNLGPECLSTLHYNSYGKPFLKEPINFNISHSDEYVVCAIAKDLQVGVDVERIRSIELNDFQKVMTNEQWKEIHTSENVYKQFFTYWVSKECVIKADSRGLSIPLQEIMISGKTSTLTNDSTKWHLHPLDLGAEDYYAALALDQPLLENQISLRYHDVYS